MSEKTDVADLRHGCRWRPDTPGLSELRAGPRMQTRLSRPDAKALRMGAGAGGIEQYLNFALRGLHATMNLRFEAVRAGGRQVLSESPRDRKHREKGERCRCQTKNQNRSRRQTRAHRRAAKAFHSRSRLVSPRTRGLSPRTRGLSHKTKYRRRIRRSTEAASRSPAG